MTGGSVQTSGLLDNGDCKSESSFRLHLTEGAVDNTVMGGINDVDTPPQVRDYRVFVVHAVHFTATVQCTATGSTLAMLSYIYITCI